jgi:hypothetical protein
MKFSQRKNQQASLVYLYDPIPLEKVSLDTLKAQFSRVVAVPDLEVIVAESIERKLKAQIQTARLEYTDESGGEFLPKQLEPIPILLRALPPLNIKAFGMNLHVRAVMEGYNDAGAYSMESFLANAKKLEEKLKSKLLSSSERFIYGEPTNFFDLRITPVELGGEWLHLQLHRHKDLHLTDSERIYQETMTVHAETIKELARLEQIL